METKIIIFLLEKDLLVYQKHTSYLIIYLSN